MPELPEVETTRRGIAPHVLGQRVTHVIVRNPRLRQPVSPALAATLAGHTIHAIDRRGKYLLLRSGAGTVIIHLGMSGNLRVLSAGIPAEKHDHVDIVLASGQCLRLRDPRRFGAVVWTCEDPLQHTLLRSMGPEPLDNGFSGTHLYQSSRGRSITVKQFIMDGRIVAGVGNIYASESLFLAGIYPGCSAGRISLQRYQRLTAAIKQVLKAAIAQGGTTLRDFYDGEGKPGYFQQQLNVYGRVGEPCHTCQRPIAQLRQGQRSTFYCIGCQT